MQKKERKLEIQNWNGTSRGIKSAAYVSSLFRFATTSGGRP
jgi:hypothetical protein